MLELLKPAHSERVLYYNKGRLMGLISLIVTILIAVLGIGYYFFGMRSSSFQLSNGNTAPIVQELSDFKELKDKANEIKDTVEEKAKDAVAVVEDVPKTEEKKIEQQPTAPVTNDGVEIVNRLMSTGFASKSSRKIDAIVLHSSYNSLGGDPYSVSEIVKIYESYGVSAHYIIDRNGKIYRLVEDKNISYHAGASKMPDGRQDVNDFSIGIELVNKMDTEYTKAQYDAVNNLIASLKEKYPIKSVVGHSDIAPSRKTDPWNFDWKKLK